MYPIDLRHPDAAGVYLLTDADCRDLAATSRPGMQQACVDLHGCHSLETFVRRAETAGLLPHPTPADPHALITAWCDLGWLPAQGYLWCFPGAGAWQAADTAGFDSLLEALDQAAAAWSDADIGLYAIFGLPAASFSDTPVRGTGDETVTFTLRGAYVELNQLLKLVGLCDSGAAGKAMVAAGDISVDGQREARKTAKIRAGQRVQARGLEIEVRAAGH